MTQGQDRLVAMEKLMKDGYSRGEAKAMTFWMSMPATSMADVAKSEPTRQYRLHANKYPQESPPHCTPYAWRYVFETYPENASATYQAMWAYFFEVADMLRERAERRAEEAERALDEKTQLVDDCADAMDELEDVAFHLRCRLESEENTCEEAEAECRDLRARCEDAERRIEELEDENADWYYGHKQRDSEECAKLRRFNSQQVEVIRSLQEQLKEKDEEITALQHCVAERQEQRDKDMARQDKLAGLP